MMNVLLGVLLVVSSSLACPTFFYVIDLVDYRGTQGVEAESGTYVLKNGTQLGSSFKILPAVIAQLPATFCSTVSVVVTDGYPDGVGNQVGEWIKYECRRLQRTDCHTVYSHTLPRVTQPPTTPPPTRPPTTARPTADFATCMERLKQSDCERAKEGCQWFGVLHGCQSANFCGFTSREQCIGRKGLCRWTAEGAGKRGKCSSTN
jgi:hypothetical protein